VILLWALGQPSVLIAGEEALIAVEVKEILADPRGGMSPVVLLEEKAPPKRILPIWVGLFEARAIAMEMEAIVTPRPMTHDLIKNILEGVEAKVRSIVVTELRDNTFYASIILELANKKEIRIDSRPSDAIALALRVRAPIYVDKEVMATAPRDLDKPAKDVKEISIIDPYGFSVQRLTPALAAFFRLDKPEGLLISDVKQGSSAERDGLKRGDVVLQIGGKKIEDLVTFEERLHTLAAQKSDVMLQIQRVNTLLDLLLHAPK
jgi:hypothetical protein